MPIFGKQKSFQTGTRLYFHKKYERQLTCDFTYIQLYLVAYSHIGLAGVVGVEKVSLLVAVD